MEKHIEKSLQIIFNEIKSNSKILELGGSTPSVLTQLLKDKKNCKINIVNIIDIHHFDDNFEKYDYILINLSIIEAGIGSEIGAKILQKGSLFLQKLTDWLNKEGVLFLTALNSSYIGFISNLIAGGSGDFRYAKNFIHELLINNKIYPEKIYGIPKRLDDSEFKHIPMAYIKELLQVYKNDEDAWVNHWIFQAKKQPSAVKIKSATLPNTNTNTNTNTNVAKSKNYLLSNKIGLLHHKNIEFRKIDIIIPIFNAFFDLVDCIESVLQNTFNINYRIIAINDKSIDTRVANYLESLKTRLKNENFLLIENSENLGFVKSVNKGMAIDNYSDMVLLNSDTIVTKNWLEEIINTSHQDLTIGTITPFSNNGEIVSFPVPNKNNSPESTPKIDRILDAMNGLKNIPAPDLPTGVGFCYFIRRRLVNQIGFFDEYLFGKGYGEENDFSIRAKKAGWRNVLCLTAFVIHKGKKSFGNEQEIKILRRNNLSLLTNKHPEYADDVRNFIKTDPLKIYRNLLLSTIVKKSILGRRVLHIMHPFGGGTERHINDVIENLNQNYHHVKGVVSGKSILIDDYTSGCFSVFSKLENESWPEFISGVVVTLNISIIHVHHFMGNRKGVLEGVKKSGFKYIVTIHDGYLWCPNTSFVNSKKEYYCGVEQDEEICNQCENFDALEWRKEALSFLRGAEFIISPSQWNTEWIEKSFLGVDVQTIPHGIPYQNLNLSSSTTEKVQKTTDNADVIRVGVIGGIGSAKGANMILKLVELTRIKKFPIKWIIIGAFSPKNKIQKYPEDLLTIHGRYHPDNLNKIMDDCKPSLILYPGPKPENYCYTLSEIMPFGIPLLVNPDGAVAERVLELGAGWSFKNVDDMDAILDQIMLITSTQNKKGYMIAATNTHKYQGNVEFEKMIKALIDIYNSINTPPIIDDFANAIFSNERLLDSFREVKPIPSNEDLHLPEWVAPSIQKKRLLWLQK